MHHAPTLVLGDGGRPGTIDFTDFAETCYACVLADDSSTGGPCTQGGATLAPASLVQVRPAPRFEAIPFRTAIVVDVVSGHGRRFLLLWFWALGGSPRLGTNAFAAEDTEVRALNTTVDTLPELSRKALARTVAAAMAEGGKTALTVAPIAARLGL